jgi:outer membrane protein
VFRFIEIFSGLIQMPLKQPGTDRRINASKDASKVASKSASKNAARAVYPMLAISFAALVSIGGAARAQSLDLVSIYQDAVKYDALLASAVSALEAAQERAIQARAGLLPTVTNTMGLSRIGTESNLSTRREFNSRAFAINLNYPLYRKQNVEVFEQGRLQIALFEAQLEQARQDLMIRVSQAYFDVLTAQDNLSTIRAQKRAISEQLASAKRNFEVGTATITDQQEAQARFDLNIAQELAGQNDLAVKRSALELLSGKPAAALHGLVKDIALTSPMPARESEWAQSARDFNLGVLQAQVSSEVAKREIDRQRFGHYPTLDLVSSLQRSDSASAQLLGVRSNSASIGVQFSVPLYAGGAIDSRVREAIALQSKANTDLENARRQAEQGVRATFLGVNSGLGQVRALEAAERSSQLALDSNLLGYQVGVRINIDVLNAQQQLFTTRRDLAKARYDVLVSGLKLKQSAGVLAEDDLKSVNNLLAPVAAAAGDAGSDAPRITTPADRSVPTTSGRTNELLAPATPTGKTPLQGRGSRPNIPSINPK